MSKQSRERHKQKISQAALYSAIKEQGGKAQELQSQNRVSWRVCAVIPLA